MDAVAHLFQQEVTPYQAERLSTFAQHLLHPQPLGQAVLSRFISLRLSVQATQKEMAHQMGVSLRQYQNIESRLERLDEDRLRSATFAALRIAVDQDGELPNPELFAVFEELLQRFGAISWRSRSVH
jgi:hypothetical protein